MDNIKYTIIRFNGEILFLPNIIDYGNQYNKADILLKNVTEDIFQKLVELRNNTPQDKIFDLDENFNPIYKERYTQEEKNKMELENKKNFYTNELNIANKFFQEYNFGLNGTENDFKEVQEYLKSIRVTTNTNMLLAKTKKERPKILYQYDV